MLDELDSVKVVKEYFYNGKILSVGMTGVVVLLYEKEAVEVDFPVMKSSIAIPVEYLEKI